jgi:hypothetical protein
MVEEGSINQESVLSDGSKKGRKCAEWVGKEG